MTSILNFIPFGNVLTTLSVCGLFTFCGATTTAPAVAVSVTATSTPSVLVVTSVNGRVSTTTLDAPYGVSSHFEVSGSGPSATTVATATPITAAQAAQMQQDFEREQAQMQALFSEQQQLLEQLFSNTQ